MEDSLKEIRKALYEQRKAFDAHIAPERERLWGYCRRLTGSIWDGEDLVQETLIRAFGGLTRYWSPISPRAYLFRIATRLWIDRQQKGVLDEVALLDDDAAAAPEEGLSEEGLKAIGVMVATLPPRQRVVFLLTQAFEFTAAEVGEMLEITEGAVKASLHRARRSLASPAVSLKECVVPPLLDRFVDAFNKKDIDALCSLFREDVSIDIVGMAEEHGRDELKGSSIKYTLEDEDANEAVIFRFLDDPVVLLLKHLPDGSRAVSEVILVCPDGDQVARLRTYYFCPQVLAEVAEAFGAPALSHGYHLGQ